MGGITKIKLPKWPWAMIGIIIVFTLFSGHTGPIAHVTRMLSSAAQVSEAAGLAASTVLSAGTELTTVVTTAVLSITTTSLDLVQASWHGVDLTDMAIAKVRGRVHVDGATVIDKWLHSSAGQAMTRRNEPTVLEDWTYTVSTIGISMPYAAVHHEVLLVTGNTISFQPSKPRFLHHGNFSPDGLQAVSLTDTFGQGGCSWEEHVSTC